MNFNIEFYHLYKIVSYHFSFECCGAGTGFCRIRLTFLLLSLILFGPSLTSLSSSGVSALVTPGSSEVSPPLVMVAIRLDERATAFLHFWFADRFLVLRMLLESSSVPWLNASGEGSPDSKGIGWLCSLR